MLASFNFLISYESDTVIRLQLQAWLIKIKAEYLPTSLVG